MKQYTKEELLAIERAINNLIMAHDRWEICELCKKEEYALNYFINKAITEISTLEHIKQVINDK